VKAPLKTTVTPANKREKPPPCLQPEQGTTQSYSRSTGIPREMTPQIRGKIPPETSQECFRGVRNIPKLAAAAGQPVNDSAGCPETAATNAVESPEWTLWDGAVLCCLTCPVAVLRRRPLRGPSKAPCTSAAISKASSSTCCPALRHAWTPVEHAAEERSLHSALHSRVLAARFYVKVNQGRAQEAGGRLQWRCVVMECTWSITTSLRLSRSRRTRKRERQGQHL